MRLFKCLYFPHFLTDLVEIWYMVLLAVADSDKQIKFDISTCLKKNIIFFQQFASRNCLPPENGLLQVKYFYAFQ